MWKISDTCWLNPLAISLFFDVPGKDEVTVYFGSNQHWREFRGPERQAVLAHLARNSTPVVPSDADLSGWPYDEDEDPTR